MNWAAAVSHLYRDADTWQAMSLQARKFTRTACSCERGRALMAKPFKAVGIDLPHASAALVSR